MPPHYLNNFPYSWWSSSASPDHELGRQIYEDTYHLLTGTLKPDLKLCANLIKSWINCEYRVETSDKKAIEIQSEWFPVLTEILSELLHKVHGSESKEEDGVSKDLYEVYDWWMSFSLRHGKIGAIEQPEPGTMRAIFRQKWDAFGGRFRGPGGVFRLLAADPSAEGLGDATEPLPYTYRRLCRDLWSDDTKRNAQLAIHWAELEAEKGRLGTPSKTSPDAFEPKYSARWIFHDAWKHEGTRTAQLACQWAQIEAEKGGLGKPSEADPEIIEPQYSARWILREAWKQESMRTAGLAKQWAQIEAGKGNLGEPSEADPEIIEPRYSARWILREAWKQESMRTAELAKQWAQIEAGKGNLGEPSEADPEIIEPRYSARWILREAWKQGSVRTTDFAKQWAQIEAGKGNLGEPSEADPEIIEPRYSARWILREAWKQESMRTADFANQWAQIEAGKGNLGEPSEADPEIIEPRYSARWILREAWKCELFDKESLFSWALIEHKAMNFGSKEERYSARWCFDQYDKHPSKSKISSDRWLGSMAAEESNLEIARLHYKNLSDRDYVSHLREWAKYEEAAGTVEGDCAPSAIFALWRARKTSEQLLQITYQKWIAGSADEDHDSTEREVHDQI